MQRIPDFIYNILQKEQSRLSLWFPVFFATGIGIYFLLPEEPSKWTTLGAIEGLIFLAVLLRRRIFWLRFLLIPATILAGFTLVQVRSIYLESAQTEIPSSKLYLSGRIQKLDYNTRGNRRMIIDDLRDFDGNPVPGRFRISMRSSAGELREGQCVELVAKLFPRAKASLPGGYQFDRKSFYQKLSGSGYAESRVFPVECRQPPGWRDKLAYKLAHLRSRIINHIKSVLPPDEAAVTAAIVAGEQGGISRELINHYRDSGLAHFLSISGLHMTMIAGLMFFLIRLLMALIPPLALYFDSKKVSAWFAIFISLVYLFISGMAVPAQRAFVMTFIVLLGVLFDRRAISMKTISWAAVIVLLFSPEALIGASFQMSFAAVVALIAFYEKFAAPLQRFLNSGPGSVFGIVKILKVILLYIFGILISDLVASLATLPFAIYHFNRIAVFTSLANLMAGPVIGFVIMPFTLLSLLLMPFGLDVWSLKIVGFGIGVVNDITAYVSSLPSAGYQVLSMPLWGLLLIVFGGLWLCIWKSGLRLWGIPFIAVGFLSIAAAQRPDVLVSDNQRLFAVRDNTGRMVVLPARGNSFTKQVWLEKTASSPLSAKEYVELRKIYKGQKTNLRWLDLQCGKKSCLYHGRVRIEKSGRIFVDDREIKAASGLGAAVYLKHPAKIVTVRSYIGNRIWNFPD